MTSRPRLTDRIVFDRDGNLSFHWADSEETCAIWRERIKTDPDLRADFEEKCREMEDMRNLPVWIRRDNTVSHTHFYALYENTIGGTWRFGSKPLEVSLVSPSGPWRWVRPSECFNPVTYHAFVMIDLLLGKLPYREFRLRVKAKLLLEHGPGFNGADLVALEQVTAKGFLFRVPEELAANTSLLAHPWRFLIHARGLEDLSPARTSNPFYTHDKTQSFTIDPAGVSAEEFYTEQPLHEGRLLFVPFKRVAENNAVLAKKAERFVESAHQMVQGILAKKNSAA